MFSASSSVLGPGRPVVDGPDVWCAGSPTSNQWLKVDLGSTQISTIAFFKLIVKQKLHQSFSQYGSFMNWA